MAAPMVAAPMQMQQQPMQMQGQFMQMQGMAPAPMVGGTPFLMSNGQPMMVGGMPLMAPAGDIFGDGPLMVKQKLDMMELLGAALGIDYEQANKYDVFGAAAGQMYMHEKSGCCERQFCDIHREADIFLRLNLKQGQQNQYNWGGDDNEVGPVIMRLHKNRHCGGPYDCCCRLTATVHDAGDNQFAEIYDEQWAEWCCQQSTLVKDSNEKSLGKLNGCLCQLGIFCPCLADVMFNFYTPDGVKQEDGYVCKKWGGWKECFTNANNFEIGFPKGSDVNLKSTMIAQAIIVDFLVFESRGDNHN